MVALMAGRGAHYTHKDRADDYPTITVDAIQGMLELPQDVPKEVAWWFCPTDYIRFDARSADRQREAGRAYFLIADIDKGSPSLETVLQKTRQVIGNGFAFWVYSSKSATQEELKWRVLIPLAEPLAGAEYSYYQKALRQGYAQREVICDAALDTLSQPVYLPNRGPHYQFHVEPGYPLQFLFEDGKHPLLLWAEEYKQDDQAPREIPQTSGSRSQIAAFNRRYSIDAMLSAYGCLQSPYNPDLWRYQYASSQHYGGIRIMRYPDADRWVSRSDTFNELGAGKPSSAGTRAGDAFDLYVRFSCNGNVEQALQFAQQCLKEEDDRRYGAATAAHGKQIYDGLIYIGAGQLGPAGHREEMKASAQRAAAMATPDPEIVDADHDWNTPWPAGVVGEVAKYLYRSSSRPVKQFAIAKALYVMAGMAGQRYNIEGFGLNLYFMLVGNSGTGKGEARRGAKRVYGSVGDAAQDPSGVAAVFDNNFPASESGLRKMFDEQGTRAIYREDADALLESLTSTQPGSNGDRLRSALSEFYDQSGEGLNMGAIRYAKLEDSTGVVQSPALTLGLDLQVDPFKRFLGHGVVLSTGIAARFIYIPRYGKRTHAQHGRQADVPPVITEHLKTIWNGIRMQTHTTRVQWEPAAHEAFLKMDWDVTERIRNGEPEEDLLNRAHMNAARVAANIAVGINQIDPIVTAEVFQWASGFVMRGYEECLNILGKGEAGSGERVRVAKVRQAVLDYVRMEPSKRVSTYKTPRALEMHGDVIPEKYFIARLHKSPDFKGTDTGWTTEEIIRRAIAELVRQEFLLATDRGKLVQERGMLLEARIMQPLYMLGPAAVGS